MNDEEDLGIDGVTMQPVDSSNIHSIGYDADRRNLHVQFRSSPARYIYHDFGSDDHAALQQADSKGTHHRLNILNKFRFTKIPR